MAEKNQRVAIALFVLLAAIWGSSFIIMKYALHSFSPVQIGAIRISFAWLFMALISWKSYSKFRWKDFFPLLAVGWMGNGFPYLLFPLAVQHIDSSVVGIINSLVPLFTLIIGFFWFQLAPKKSQIFGLLVGFVGAYFLIKPEGSFGIDANFKYAGLAMIASLCYAISINTINAKLKHLNALTITNLSLLTVGPFMILGLFFTDFQARLSAPMAMQHLGLLALLGIVGSAIAVMIFNYLIKISSPIFSSSVTYVIPLVAIVWGFIDGEVIGQKHVVGVVCILLGIYLVNKKKGKVQS